MDYNKIKIFQIVAEQESITKAAKILHVTQPAVSQQIALLEEQLGFKLLRRVRGSIVLSQEAQRLLPQLRDGFNVIEAAVAEVRDSLQHMAGLIRLGVLIDHSTDFSLSDLIMRFNTRYPQINFDITFGTNSEIEQGLKSGELDLGLSIVFADRSAFHRQTVARAKHCFVMHRKIAAEGLENIIRSERLIDFSEDFLCLRPWIQKNAPQLIRSLQARRPNLVVPHHLLSLEMVAAGWAAAVLPEHLCKSLLESKALRRIAGKDLNVELDLAYLKERSLRSYEKVFLGFASAS